MMTFLMKNSRIGISTGQKAWKIEKTKFLMNEQEIENYLVTINSEISKN
jgi:hypothetical protein